MTLMPRLLRRAARHLVAPLAARQGVRGISGNAYTGVDARSHSCGCLRREHVGQRVELAGWLQSVRELGELTFAGLRDARGVTQLVLDVPEEAREGLRAESVVRVSGTVRERPPEMHNRELGTGAVEVTVDHLEVLNAAKQPLAIPVERYLNLEEERKHKSKLADLPGTEARLQSRHLDLRGARLQRNLRVRAAVLLEARCELAKELGFVEVETPLLFKSTPEGAREFLVPARSAPGACYALPQSPQQYKQLLMAGGVERYFQVAKCFRDEGGRADRQPEFTQLDLEMSFASADHVRAVTERVVRAMWLAGASAAEVSAKAVSLPPTPEQSAAWAERNVPPLLRGARNNFAQGAALPELPYEEAMERFGSDKPDRRFGLTISDAPQTTLGADDGAVFRAIVVPAGEWAPSRKVAEAAAAEYSTDTTTCVAVVQTAQDGTWGKMHLAKSAPAAARARLLATTPDQRNQCLAASGAAPGDHVLVAVACDALEEDVSGTMAGHWRRLRDDACGALGRARLGLGSPDPSALDLFWVTGFPLFEPDADVPGRLQAVHHPFTMPHPDDVELVAQHDTARDGISEAILGVRGQHYDLVCNGCELGGGSVRIHAAPLQRHVLSDVLGLGEARTEAYFGHLLAALASGCPPHAGIALGVDRMLSLMCNEPSLRDVMAFPKSAAGADPLTGAPSLVPDEALAEYGLERRRN